jgi:hypothetical protein
VWTSFGRSILRCSQLPYVDVGDEEIEAAFEAAARITVNVTER